MPVNEILAPAYIRVKYRTPVASHNLTLYFANPTSQGVLSGDVGQAVNGDTIPYGEIVRQIAQRWRAIDGVRVESVESIEVWASVANGVNVFQGYATLGAALTGAGAAYVSSAYRMWVFGQTTTRQKMRLTGFEAVDSAPQRFALAIPASDDGGVTWYVLKSGVPFATQDGLRVTTSLSMNQGYNRKLARSYGRDLAP